MLNVLKTHKFSLLVILSIFWIACAHKEQATIKTPEKSAPSIEAKQVAAEMQAAFVTEVQFAKNKHTLSAASRKEIKKLLARAQQAGNLGEVQVAVWADQEYPSVHTKNLATEQVDLAKRRGTEISGLLKTQNRDLDPKVHNMAERPGMWGEFVANEGARLKKAFEVAGIPNSDTSVKTPAKTGHAVILVSIQETEQ